MKKFVAAIVVTLFLASTLAIAYAQYDVQVNAVGDSTPLQVPVYWSWSGGSGTTSTPFTIIGITGDLTLIAPSTHEEDYTFYVFSCWDLDGADQTAGVTTVIVSTATTATAEYTKVLSVSKDLIDDDTVPTPYKFDGITHIYVDPEHVPVFTEVYFDMTITVTPIAAGITDVTVKDGIGADLILDSATPSAGSEGDAKAGKGKMGATIVTWTMSGDFTAEQTLDLSVHTGLNSPGGPNKRAPQYQEYTSPDTHDLNSGPVVYFTYGGNQYVLVGPPVTVTAELPV